MCISRIISCQAETKIPWEAGILCFPSELLSYYYFSTPRETLDFPQLILANLFPYPQGDFTLILEAWHENPSQGKDAFKRSLDSLDVVPQQNIEYKALPNVASSALIPEAARLTPPPFLSLFSLRLCFFFCFHFFCFHFRPESELVSLESEPFSDTFLTLFKRHPRDRERPKE